jgi:flagellar biosynthesis/type III secretory pathway protein FliH
MALVILKSTDTSSLVVESRVLKRDTVMHIHSLDDALESARIVALHELQLAKASAAREVEAQLKATVISMEAEKTQALLQYAEQLERFQQAVSERFVSTVMDSVRTIVGDPLPRGFFVQAATAAAEMIGDPSKASFHVSADDMHSASAALEEISEAGHVSEITLVVDRNLSAGQCFLKTPIGKIELDLATQLSALQRSLDLWHSGYANAEAQAHA